VVLANYLQVARLSWQRSLAAWIYVPIGTVLVLLVCFGVNSLISIGGVSFPASVACMILLFFTLISSELVLGERRTRTVVKYVDIPVESITQIPLINLLRYFQCGFALRYINIFFTPSFVTIPLSEPISGVEIGKIIGIFGESIFVCLCLIL
jgi:hypothetical protein